MVSTTHGEGLNLVDLIFLTLMGLSAIFFIQAHYPFAVNSHPGKQDPIGSSISFDQPFAISNICLCGALAHTGTLSSGQSQCWFFLLWKL
jgi:hypothetical protein